MLLGTRVFTSNVDGQFQKAGFLKEQIHECHGSIHQLQWINECKSGLWIADGFEPDQKRARRSGRLAGAWLLFVA